MTATLTDERAEFLAWRRTGIGASDVAGILGIARWSSPWSVWADKVGLAQDGEQTEAMELGLALEDGIARMFHRRTGLYVAGAQTRYAHPTEPWARATLDGKVYDHPVLPGNYRTVSLDNGYAVEPAVPLGGLESKATGDSSASWETDGIPAYYQAQGQFQMWVTGMEHTWFAVLHASFGLAFRVYELHRDEADIALIAERCHRFWHDHVLTGDPPPADGHTATTEALRGIPAAAGEEVELDDDTVALLDSLRLIKADRKNLDSAIAERENQIKAALGEATEGLHNGERLVSWREQSRAEHVVAASTSRVLRITPTKKETT